MTKVPLDTINLTDVEGLRVNYERQKWLNENKDYDPNDETVIVEALKVSHTDRYNPLPSYLK